MTDWCYTCAKRCDRKDMVRLTPKWYLCKDCHDTVGFIACSACQESFPRDADELNLTYSNSPICDPCMAEDFHRRQRSPRRG